MRKIIVSEFITLDGVVEAPGGEPDFKYTGWSADYFSQDYIDFKLKEIREAGALLLGRITYEGFAEAWPGREDELGFSERMNSIPKYVVSTTLQKADWNNTTLIRDRVAEQLQALKEMPGGDILIHGSGTLAQSLMRQDLVDEYRFMMHPTILGIGRRLYEDIGERKMLKLAEAKVFDTGTLMLTYHPDKR